MASRRQQVSQLSIEIRELINTAARFAALEQGLNGVANFKTVGLQFLLAGGLLVQQGVAIHIR